MQTPGPLYGSVQENFTEFRWQHARTVGATGPYKTARCATACTRHGLHQDLSRLRQYRGGRICRQHLACQPPAASSAEVLVQEVQTRISNSDYGVALSVQEQQEINHRLAQLTEIGKKQIPRPLESEDLWGNFNVAFTSTLDTTKQDRQPAGGRFRSGLGRKIFQTKRLFQSVIKPDLVTNKVEFAFLGVISGFVGLRGKLEPTNGLSDKDTVKVRFEPPRLSLGRNIDLAIGPSSSVQLTTTFLTPSVRVGRGSRGSWFFFTKGGPADVAGMDSVGLGQTTPVGWAILAAVGILLLSGARALWSTHAAVGQVAAAAPALLAALLAACTVRTVTNQQHQKAPAVSPQRSGKAWV